jgi:hypothetical protein
VEEETSELEEERVTFYSDITNLSPPTANTAVFSCFTALAR